MKHFIFIIIFLAFTAIQAQAPDLDWVKLYGGDLGEYSRSMVKTQDGGYLIGGWSNSSVSGNKTNPMIGFNYDYWILKIDPLGTIQWQKTIGGGRTWGLGDEVGEILDCIVVARDGSGYYLCGYSDSGVVGMKTEPSYGGFDYWVVKIDLDGNLVWQKTIGGSANDMLFAAASTTDGGCVVGGISYSGISGVKSESSRGVQDYWVIKLDSSGVLEWQKTLGGSSIDELYSIVPTVDGYLLAGYSTSSISGDKTENTNGYGDFWIIKLNLSGAVVWQKNIGGTGGDLLYTAIKTSNGYLLGGESTSDIGYDKTENSRGSSDYWMVAIDEQGNPLWDRTFGGSGADYLLELSNTPDGGYVLCGSSDSNISGDKSINVYGGNDGWVIRTDGNGNMLWQLGIGGNGEDGLNEIISLDDGAFLIGGVSHDISSNTGNIAANTNGGIDYLVVKLSPEQLSKDEFSSNNIKVYPNPTLNDIEIDFIDNLEQVDVEIFNELSQQVSSLHFQNQSNICLPLPNQKGVYLLKIKNGANVWFRKIVKN